MDGRICWYTVADAGGFDSQILDRVPDDVRGDLPDLRLVERRRGRVAARDVDPTHDGESGNRDESESKPRADSAAASEAPRRVRRPAPGRWTRSGPPRRCYRPCRGVGQTARAAHGLSWRGTIRRKWRQDALKRQRSRSSVKAARPSRRGRGRRRIPRSPAPMGRLRSKPRTSSCSRPARSCSAATTST